MITPGTIIDERYEVISTLGAGGFGAVYRAKQLQFDREVAVKLLSLSLLQVADGVARFEREAKAINALKHKNIVALYGYGLYDQAPYMVMELVTGTSLDATMRNEESIEPMRALRLVRQVFEGLGHAHSAGIVHRDLKPSNIMVTKDAEGKECVKLIDFGLVKLMPHYGESAQKLTETGYAVGTTAYMAPEQALGGGIDARTDVYAAGCIFYHMLTGTPPFVGNDALHEMAMHLNEQPPRFHETLSGRGPAEALYTFILNCMAKQASDRYQSCDEAVKDLDQIIAGKYTNLKLPGTSATTSRSSSTTKMSRQTKVGIAIGVALCLGLVATYVMIDGYKREQQRQALAETDKLFVQDAIRSRAEAHEYPPPVALPQLRDIKERDDIAHFLSKPQRFFVLVALARNAAAGGDNEHARQYAGEAMALLPDVIESGYRGGIDVCLVYQRLGDTKRMLSGFEFCEKCRDTAVRFDARRELVDYYIDLKEWDKASAYAEKNLDERSMFVSSGLAQEDMAKIQMARGNYQAAYDRYLEIIRKTKDEPGPRMAMARLCRVMGREKEALDWETDAKETEAQRKQPAPLMDVSASLKWVNSVKR